MGQKDERFTIPFRFNFANMTSKHCDYVKSPHYIDMVRALCRCRKMKDNMDDDQGLLDLQKRGSRQEPSVGYANMNQGRQAVNYE